MTVTRKRLWIGTFVVLAIIAIRIVVLAPWYKKTSPPPKSAPDAQLGSGSGCAASELPKSLDEPPPPSVPKGEGPDFVVARQKITVCMLQRLWPTAKVQFGWDKSGEGRYDLIFPDNAYRRASVVSFSQVSESRNTLTFAAFIWLPWGDEYSMAPLVVARAGSDGLVTEYRALAVDPEARISDKKPPGWTTVADNNFEFTYEGAYPGNAKTRIQWLGKLDVATVAIVARLPDRVAVPSTNGSLEIWTLATQLPENDSLLMRAQTESATKDIRVGCETMSGSNGVVRAAVVQSDLSR